MILFVWMTISSLLVTAVTVAPGARCDANHTRLLLLVDLSHDTNLTITRLKIIVSYFITKVKDGIIKNLDVWLVDPFQKKTFFNLTKVNSSQEMTPLIDQLVKSKITMDEDLLIETFQKGLEFFQKNSFNNMGEHKQHVVVFLSHCKDKCTTIISHVKYRFQQFKHILMLALMSSPSNIRTKKYSEYYQRDYSTVKQSYLTVDNDDDFTKYNPVTVYVCRECLKGWIHYSQTVYNRLSCYFVDEMNASISWTQASNFCQSKKSNLPMFETEKELMFVKKYLRQTKVATDANLKVSLATSVVVYLGLKLNLYWPKNKPLTWMNKKPFSLDSNLAEIAQNRKNCLALTLQVQTNTGKDEIRWTLVSCDGLKSRLLVCEMEVNLFHNKAKLKAKLLEALERSLERKYFGQTDKDSITHDDSIMFDCKDDDKNIIYSYVCDGKEDCSNGRDEQYCTMIYMENELRRFSCQNPNRDNDDPIFSVRLEARCDGIQDCPDGSDELGCDGCMGRHCKDGTCLPLLWLSRDFEECPLFLGANGTVYLNVSYRCQGQCSGLIQFHQEITFCNSNNPLDSSKGQQFNKNKSSGAEWAPKCLYLKDSYERLTGCDDRFQLRNCGTFQCPEGFFKCMNSYCLPVYNIRDGVMDCPFGEDEDKQLRIAIVAESDLFHCKKSDVSIYQEHKCDSFQQCPFGDDETDCHVTCPPGFKCNGDAVGVRNYSQVSEIKSLNFFDIKTKFLNVSGIDLSKLKETFYLPILLELHASKCNLKKLDIVLPPTKNNDNIYMVDFSYNKLQKLINWGPMSSLYYLVFLNLSHNEQLTEMDYFSVKSEKLHTLDLSFTRISELNLHVFFSSKTMRYINLCHTKIIHIGFLTLMKRLEYLNLEKISVSTEDIIGTLKYISVRSALYVDSYKYCCPQISTGGTPKHACHAPPEAFSSCEDLLSDSLKRSLLWLVAGVSLAGNIVVITSRLFYDKGVFKKGYGIFVTNLSVSDFIMGVYLLVIASTDVRYRDEYVLHESVWRHSILCQTAGFLSTLSCETSTFFVFLITLDRCLVIKFPFGDHWFTKLGLVLSVLSSWMLGFILASIPLMYPEWIIYSSNGMCLGLPLAIGLHPGWHYSFGVFICFNFALFLCIASGQLLIFRLIFSSHSFQMTNPQSVARRVQDINVAKQLFLVVLSNFLCWFPICVIGFMSLTGYIVSPDTYAWLIVFVMPLNAAVNPMIYTIPVMYSKWQGFKKGESTRIHSRVNKPESLETKL